MRLPSLPFVVLDTETTGLVPRVHRVIEFASIEVRDGKVQTEYEQLFHHVDVPPVVQVLTRIRTADLQSKPALAEHREDILRHLPEDTLLVGQNIPFDIGMLKGEGIDLSSRPYIDTSMLASLVFPELESYSLGYLSTVLQLNHDPPHRALGDVRATLGLLGKCWERLLELPEDLRGIADAIMERGPKGYRMLFEALPPSKATKEPAWIHWEEQLMPSAQTTASVALKAGRSGTPDLLDEPLDPTHLQSVITGALADSSTRHWIAVKSLRPILRRLPELLVEKIRVLHPPYALIDVDAVLRFSQQKEYTADEATLALKLAWYEPQRRDQLPLHGGEDAVWNGKLSCTATSKAYVEQFNDLPSVVLLDHRDLLAFTMDPPHPGKELLKAGCHVMIDDASMLEDTATKAFGWYCGIDDLRAASEGNALLTRFMDTLQLWIEKVRQFQDIRYLTSSDLTSPEAKGLARLLDDVQNQEWPAQILDHLDDLQKILEAGNLPHRITWIEQKPNGGQMLQSVPERIGQLLADTLFKRFPTTLLIPQGSANMLPEILPSGKTIQPFDHPTIRPFDYLTISFDSHPNLEEILTSPPPGKTIILLPGKGAIEDLYVKYAEGLEAKGVEMICQGMNGGMGRMQAEFLAACGACPSETRERRRERNRTTPALWLITPWMFEGVDLPERTVDHLILKTLPFDHPAHPVLSRRSQHYRDPFNDYSLPRLMHRLFRLLRTYARIKTPDGDVRLLDDRITTKAYGKVVRAYLEQFGTLGTPSLEQPAQPAAIKKETKAAPKKKSTIKDQPTLF